ncbi:MAG: AMP-binding protein, partial [Desulfobacterales bacterium]|nr:AMP-binding protein [Desulfobacterales bacterium]
MTEYKKSYFHSGGTVPLLGLTIPEYFTQVAKRFLYQEAVVSIPQSKRLTYSALSESVDLLARGLVASGFGKGDRIGIWSTNNLEWLLLQMA